MKKFIPVFSILAVLTLGSSCQMERESRILSEEFMDNRLGWVEEKTASHHLSIDEGVYHIKSQDTNTRRSSTGSIKEDYLVNLPPSYEINTSMQFIDGNKEKTNFGLLLYSASIEYQFAVYPSGWIMVYELDYNLDSTVTILSKFIDLDTSVPSAISIRIKGSDFNLFVNKEEIGTAAFKSKPNHWHELRLYTSKLSAVDVEFLRIF